MFFVKATYIVFVLAVIAVLAGYIDTADNPYSGKGLFAICCFVALISALNGGVFKAFSEFIMRALKNSDEESAVSIMQRINIDVIRTEFLVAFFALFPLSISLALYGFYMLEGLARNLLIGAGITYVASVYVVTLFGNVPMNRKLSHMNPCEEETLQYWPVYVAKWTRFNHVRTVGSVATSGLYLLAAVQTL